MDRFHCRTDLLRIMLLAILLAWLPACRLALGQEFFPVADTYTHDANPNSNYGLLADLIVKKGNSTNFRKSYLRFNIGGAGIVQVNSAVLRLYASTSVAVTMNVYQSTDAWSETTLTWNNAPADGTLITSVALPASPGYAEWDITPYVQSQFSGGDMLISLMVFPATVTSPTINFNSRQALLNKPVLLLNNNLQPPAAPGNLVATAISYNKIGLTWQDNSTTETGFSIERKPAGGIFALVASPGADVTAWTDTLVEAGALMTYRIRASNAAGNSPWSDEDSAATPVPPEITYYVDATAGSDAGNGLTPATAWKSLAKVNATVFVAGNRIMFKAGEVWTGRLYPKGSGIPGCPLRIGMYGSGPKPLISGNGMTGTGVLYLYNQQYWEISDLEITNDATTAGDRRGVRIEAENYGTARHIYLNNLEINHIKGIVGQGRPEKRTGGIGFAIVDVSVKETHFDDIRVENCSISDCENQGIITECVSGDGYYPYTAEWNSMKITNAVIRNNIISGISKNAMIIRLFEGGLVENNLCYNTANGISGNTIFSAACYGTVFQFNEGYGNHSPDADGSLYDADLRSPSTVWQYSYSHDNAHGLFWTCTDQADDNVICRYNLSQNDQGIIFCINYPVTSVKVYNNTVYCPSWLSPIIISERNNGGGGTRTYTFNNNLIFNLSPTASYQFTSGYARTIDYNCFWGIHPPSEPGDPHKVTTNPMLVNPGSGGAGFSTVNGYKLQTGSSCISTGKVISSNGGRDFWGNPLYNGLPDIGMHEFTLPPSAPLNLQHLIDQDGGVMLNWQDNSSNETGFIIERKDNAGSFTQVTGVGAGVTGYAETVNTDTAHLYRVCAFNAEGNSGYTNVVQATQSWLGAISSDWHLAGNWAAGLIPDSSTFTTVHPSLNQPWVTSSAIAKYLWIKPSGSLTVGPSATLQVNNELRILDDPPLPLPGRSRHPGFEPPGNPNE